MQTPEEVVTAMFAALNTDDWHGVTMLCDPLGLVAFKRQTMTILSEFSDDYESDTEFGESTGAMDVLRFEVANTSSIEEVREMAPGRVFVRWLQARSLSCYDDVDTDHGCRKAGELNGQRTVRAYRYSVLGGIADGPDITHVLYRPTVFEAAEYREAYEKRLMDMSEEERRFSVLMQHRGDPCVVSCRKQDDGSWKIVAKRDLLLFDSLDVVKVRNASA